MKEKIKMITKVLLIFSLIILCLVLFYYHKKVKSLEEKNNEFKERLQGMQVTMIGGSNMKENGNVNACGYVIISQNGELILVDGGRDLDASFVLEYIKRYGKGTVNHWYLTHAHTDHVGAIIKLLEEEDIIIENLYYSFNSLDWYKEFDERGFESEEKMINSLNNPKIKNKIECTKYQEIIMDNIKCEILKIANPEITNSDNGNDSSMVFKMTALDVDKSILFLGDAFIYSSKELMEEPEKLKADAVQMSHHGQNGTTKEVYEAIKPELCFFNAPEWLYNNDIGIGYDTGEWQSIIVRGWMNEMGAKNIVAYEGDRTVRFFKDKIQY